MAWDGRDDPVLPVIHLLEDGEELEVFRGIKRDEASLEDFLSQYEQGMPARKVQRRSALLWFGVSATVTAEATASRMMVFPKIGTHVARLVLRSGNGFAWADTLEDVQHVSVWGDPLKLAKSVVDVYPVR